MATKQERDQAAAARAAAEHDHARAWVNALEEERRGYVVRGKDERVEAVDAQLRIARKALGEQERRAEPPQEQQEPEVKRGRGPAKDALAAARDGKDKA